MSTPISYLVDDAAQAIGDPNKQRVSPAQWLSIYNQSQRKLCEKVNLLKFRAIFDLQTAQAYSYPDEMTVMTGLEVTDSPGDDDSFRSLDEKFEDEFRATTSVRYPATTLPTDYFATVGWFYLIPRPEALITGGARITYYGLPDRVTDLNTGVLQVPAFTQDYVVRRMIIGAMEARNRLVEAKAALDLWSADVDTLQDKMDDRSQDRRSSLAPRRNRLAGMR